MKGISKKKIVLLVLISIIICIGTYKIGHALFGVHHFTFSFDPQLSPSAKQAIKNATRSSYLGPLASITHAIQSACPAVQTICVERLANNVVHIATKEVSPCICIGKDLVLLKSGAVVNTDCFTTQVINQIPKLAIKDGVKLSTISDGLKNWLLHLEKEILDQYAICWVDDYEILLTDKNDTQCVIISSISTIVDEKIREICQRVINERIAQAHGTARDYWCAADIRFEKQIIICSQKGGAYHG